MSCLAVLSGKPLKSNEVSLTGFSDKEGDEADRANPPGNWTFRRKEGSNEASLPPLDECWPVVEEQGVEASTASSLADKRLRDSSCEASLGGDGLLLKNHSVYGNFQGGTRWSKLSPKLFVQLKDSSLVAKHCWMGSAPTPPERPPGPSESCQTTRDRQTDRPTGNKPTTHAVRGRRLGHAESIFQTAGALSQNGYGWDHGQWTK